MKRLFLLVIAFASIVACEDASDNDVTPVVKPSRVVGQLIITPLGNPTDQFRYQVGSSLSVESAYPSGIVSDGPVTFDLIENSTYHITYNDTAAAWVQVVGPDTIRSYTKDQWIHTTADAMNLNLQLPATILPH